MNKNETRDILERLLDPATPTGEIHRLEEQLNRRPETRDHLETLRMLQSWAVTEKRQLAMNDPSNTLERLEHEWTVEAVDREIGRVFPFVAAAALAAAIIVGAVNLISMRNASGDPLDALLGLPQHSLDEIILAEL